MRFHPVFIVSVLLVLSCGAATAEDIELGGDNTLHVDDNEADRTATATILFANNVEEAVTIGNATVDEITKGKFCTSCKPAYFIGAADRTSTYGAVTGIIAYQIGIQWHLSTLPFDAAGLAAPNGQGISWITESNPHQKTTRYSFQYGFLREVK